ncbi:hypothetical protein JB92DRAFT_2827857 [Gautieria morchelliformis]|nr:hypothetical protein JB92DRAFT_2827857 [Gautieria morchelliformis]
MAASIESASASVAVAFLLLLPLTQLVPMGDVGTKCVRAPMRRLAGWRATANGPGVDCGDDMRWRQERETNQKSKYVSIVLMPKGDSGTTYILNIVRKPDCTVPIDPLTLLCPSSHLPLLPLHELPPSSESNEFTEARTRAPSRVESSRVEEPRSSIFPIYPTNAPHPSPTLGPPPSDLPLAHAPSISPLVTLDMFV